MYINTFINKINIRFKDIDFLGHVNNAVYLTYFEECRKAFFIKEFKLKTKIEFNFILANVHCEYIKPLKLNDNPVVKMNICKIGRKSFIFEYMICDDNTIFAKGYSTQVFFDYKLNVSKQIDMLHKETFLKYYKNSNSIT